MCGIAGIYDSIRAPTAAELQPMVSILNHRGPDAAGILVDRPLAMGMRRLSIIDVMGGDQPVRNEDQSVAVIFNGEIYNYVELRQSLLATGHRFRTKSDTEVLVHLFEDLGPGLLPHLNGMFAFALWDARRQRLFLARDRMGVKPLYYARQGSRWLFGSELKALLTQPALDTTLDHDALADYLRLGYVPRDATPYRAVRRLLPGQYLILEGDRHELATWWDLADEWTEERFADGEAEEALAVAFEDAVRLRMRSDVPVASFLSGGLDSSLVTLTAQGLSDIPIDTFTVAFDQSQFDETPFARAVATQGRTNHHEVVVAARDALDRLPLLVWHMDEPMGDSSIIPNCLISRFAAERVKVCLSGLGGDELFGGYSRYVDPGPGRIRRLFAPVPAVAGALAELMQPWHPPWSDELRLVAEPEPAWRAYARRLQVFDTRALRQIGFPASGHAEATIGALWDRYPATDLVGRRQFVDQHTYLPDQILALTDRMSMANSLEVRVPFMDSRLVRLAQRIPGSLKQTARDYKIVLKRALGRRVPPAILSRPKWGFDTPLNQWIRQPELFRFVTRLPQGRIVEQGLADRAPLQRFVESPRGAAVQARRAWSLLVLEVWLRVRGLLAPPGGSLGEILGGPS